MRDQVQSASDRDPPEDLLALIVESSSDFAIYTMDPAGTTTSWNIGAERLFGFTDAEMLGQSGDVIFTPEDQAAGIPADERRRAVADGCAIDERWHQRKDGSRFWASGQLMPLRTGTGFLKIARDRTEQHEAEQQIRERAARFHLLATSIPQLVFTTRPDGTRVWPSPQWTDYTGISFDDSIGLGWLDAVHPDDRAATQAAWDDARDRGAYYVEHRIARTNGEYRWHLTRARPIPGAVDPVEWIGTMSDIHDLRTLKDRQQMLLAELQHRTRNLLGVVQAIAGQTLRKSESIDSFRTAFEERLGALGRVQSMLSQTDHGDVPLRTIIEAELLVHGDGAMHTDKIVIAGPDLMLAATSAQALALGIHELATNAIKYGALAQPAGKIRVTWSLAAEARQHVATILWQESDVVLPDDVGTRRSGYGRELITRALPYQLNARTELVFGPDGVRCTIAVPVQEPRGVDDGR